MGRISVIIPVYNAGAYVAQSVNSALAQPETGEVLLIEDGSADDSLSICRDLAAQNRIVKLLRHPEGRNLGPGASRNLGLMHASNDLISFLDADDFFYPERFKKPLAMLSADQSIDGVYDAVGTAFESPELREQWHSERKSLITTLGIVIPPERLFDFLLIGDCGHFHGNGLLVRRATFDRCGLFHTGLTLCQDTHMWIKMAAVGRLAPGNRRPVAARRVHPNNRISKASPEEMFYIRGEMWRSLLEWGRESRLSENHMALLKFFDYVHTAYTGQPGKVYSAPNYIKKIIKFGLTKDPVAAAITVLRLLRVFFDKRMYFFQRSCNPTTTQHGRSKALGEMSK